jgi:hypothetical protein
MAEIAVAKVTPAAYLPFKTFLSAIETLEHGLPKKIDRTIWRSQSGITQSQIMMALRFFGLLNDQDEPTAALQRLVDQKDKRKEMVGSLLRHSYRSIIEHDLTKMTPKMLDEAMEEYNVSGDTKRKAVAFFLRAAKFAEVPMHPLLAAQIRNTAGAGKRRKKAAAKPSMKGHYVANIGGVAGVAHDSPRGSTKTVRMSGGGYITLSISADPFTLPAEERQFVFDLIDKLQKYQREHPAELNEEDDADEE